MHSEAPARAGYRIVIRGTLQPCDTPALEAAEVVTRGDTTEIRGPLVDQAQLYGLVDRLRDRRAVLLSLRVEAPGR